MVTAQVYTLSKQPARCIRAGKPETPACRKSLSRPIFVPPSTTRVKSPGQASAHSVAVLADVANLDMVCRDQYGIDRRLHYGQLLQSTRIHGHVRVKLAFVPDIPQTMVTQYHLQQCGFSLDLLRPKYRHGRRVANADTAMAAFAVRWASETSVQRVELWTGDGDFLRVYDAIQQAWPAVTVVFRSFEVGTATGIQALEGAWLPIAERYVWRRGDRALRTVRYARMDPRHSLSLSGVRRGGW